MRREQVLGVEVADPRVGDQALARVRRTAGSRGASLRRRSRPGDRAGAVARSQLGRACGVGLTSTSSARLGKPFSRAASIVSWSLPSVSSSSSDRPLEERHDVLRQVADLALLPGQRGRDAAPPVGLDALARLRLADRARHDRKRLQGAAIPLALLLVAHPTNPLSMLDCISRIRFPGGCQPGVATTTVLRARVATCRALPGEWGSVSTICPACGSENQADARFCRACGTALSGPSAPEAEARKTVTVVFSDVVGSTLLGHGLDPESLRQSCPGTSRRCARCSSATAAASRSSSATR